MNIFPVFWFKPFAEFAVNIFSHTKAAFLGDKWFSKTFTRLYKEIQIVNEWFNKVSQLKKKKS